MRTGVCEPSLARPPIPWTLALVRDGYNLNERSLKAIEHHKRKPAEVHATVHLIDLPADRRILRNQRADIFYLGE